MGRSSRIAYAVALAVVVGGGCARAPQTEPLVGLPPSPVAVQDATGGADSNATSVGTSGTSAPTTAKTQPVPSLRSSASPALSAADLETSSLRRPATSPTTAPGAGFDGPSPDKAGPEAISPAAAYEDLAGDAHGGAQLGALSQPAFDILQVDWNPASYSEAGRRGYSTSITIAGPAHEDGVYISYGYFVSDVRGEECQLYHILELGTPAYAHAFCGSIWNGTRRFLGRMDGRPVTSNPTAAGGTTLVGTFDDPVVPSQLEAAGRRLYNLSALTAMCAPSPDRCSADQEVDWASSTRLYRV